MNGRNLEAETPWWKIILAIFLYNLRWRNGIFLSRRVVRPENSESIRLLNNSMEHHMWWIVLSTNRFTVTTVYSKHVKVCRFKSVSCVLYRLFVCGFFPPSLLSRNVLFALFFWFSHFVVCVASYINNCSSLHKMFASSFRQVICFRQLNQLSWMLKVFRVVEFFWDTIFSSPWQLICFGLLLSLLLLLCFYFPTSLFFSLCHARSLTNKLTFFVFIESEIHNTTPNRFSTTKKKQFILKLICMQKWATILKAHM